MRKKGEIWGSHLTPFHLPLPDTGYWNGTNTVENTKMAAVEVKIKDIKIMLDELPDSPPSYCACGQIAYNMLDWYTQRKPEELNLDLMSIRVEVDPFLPPNVFEFRDADGKVLYREILEVMECPKI